MSNIPGVVSARGLKVPVPIAINKSVAFSVKRDQSFWVFWASCWGLESGLRFTAALGLSRRAVSPYSSGARPIPRVVGLALRGLELESAHG